MAKQMPIDQEFDRFIDGLKNNKDGSAEVEVEDDISDVEELEDGSAIVRMGEDKGPEQDAEFYENLAEEVMNLYDLDKVGMRYLDLIEKDKEAREHATSSMKRDSSARVWGMIRRAVLSSWVPARLFTP